MSSFSPGREERLRDTAFCLESAAQITLPGRGDLHPRYAGPPEVGLAIIAGSSVRPEINRYSPLKEGVEANLGLCFSNESQRPTAWKPPVDSISASEIIGGQIAPGIGRFNAFALAKMNQVATSGKESSLELEISIAPGRVGLAGAIATQNNEFLAVSGLWEIHDHILSKMMDIITDANAGVFRSRLDDQYRRVGSEEISHTAILLSSIFEEVRGLHTQPADKIDRAELIEMKENVDQIIAKICIDKL